jgi:hypothetical protein
MGSGIHFKGRGFVGRISKIEYARVSELLPAIVKSRSLFAASEDSNSSDTVSSSRGTTLLASSSEETENAEVSGSVL